MTAPLSSRVLSPQAQVEAAAPVQGDWAWCSKCQGVFYGPHMTASACPKGGQHVVGNNSYNYQLSYTGKYATPPVTPPVTPPATVYAFADEFDGPAGSAPDPAKWVYNTGGGGWGNGELETYTSSRANSYIDGNSNLVIAAVKTGGSYTSARLTTLGKFAQQGGHFEARIKLNSQPGLWPAFWLMGQKGSWPQCGEVDVLEDFGKSYVQATVHTPNGSSTYMKQGGVASDTNWHVYRLDWNLAGQEFTFFRDNVAYLTTPKSDFPAASWVFGPGTPNSGGLYFLLNVAVGGFVGTPNPASWPVTMLVDYVHAWE